MYELLNGSGVYIAAIVIVASIVAFNCVLYMFKDAFTAKCPRCNSSKNKRIHNTAISMCDSCGAVFDIVEVSTEKGSCGEG